MSCVYFCVVAGSDGWVGKFWDEHNLLEKYKSHMEFRNSIHILNELRFNLLSTTGIIYRNILIYNRS